MKGTLAAFSGFHFVPRPRQTTKEPKTNKKNEQTSMRRHTYGARLLYEVNTTVWFEELKAVPVPEQLRGGKRKSLFSTTPETADINASLETASNCLSMRCKSKATHKQVLLTLSAQEILCYWFLNDQNDDPKTKIGSNFCKDLKCPRSGSSPLNLQVQTHLSSWTGRNRACGWE